MHAAACKIFLAYIVAETWYCKVGSSKCKMFVNVGEMFETLADTCHLHCVVIRIGLYVSMHSQWTAGGKMLPIVKGLLAVQKVAVTLQCTTHTVLLHAALFVLCQHM